MIQTPQIITPELGKHNRHFKGSSYKDQSTIIICPTRGMLSSRVVSSWMGLVKPMNQWVLGPIFFKGFEVGDAYEAALNWILSSPDFKKVKYLLTVEEDNIIPWDALLRLLEAIDGYDAVGGLYFTKGIEGQPMCYGPTEIVPRSMVPFLPAPDTLQPCNGLGMGCTLFRLKMFRDGKIEKPFFKSQQEVTPTGFKMFSQDLYFFNNAKSAGYRFACDARVKVGHLDVETDEVW